MSRFPSKTAWSFVVPALIAWATTCASAAPAPTLDLERALAEVAAQDPLLQAQRHEVAAARARAVRAGAIEAPMLEFMLENVPVGGGFDMDEMTMRTVGVQQRLGVSGARGYARRAAEHETRAREARVDDTRWQRLAAAWEAYADAYHASERAAAAREHRAIMQRMAAAARARYESGRGRFEDLLRVEAERARIEADAVSFEAEELAARARLAQLRGLGGDGALEVLAAPSGALAPDSAAGWSSAVAGHPRVAMAGHVERSRRDAARSMRRMAWPDLTLRASYGYRGTLHEGLHDLDDMWSAGVAVMLPVGFGSREGAQAREMDAMADAALAERRAEALALEREMRALRLEARAAARTATLLADTVAVADRKALAAAWSAYETGSTDLAGVFEAAHALYTEEIDVTRARQAHARALARLLAITADGSLVGVRVPVADAPSGRDAR